VARIREARAHGVDQGLRVVLRSLPVRCVRGVDPASMSFSYTFDAACLCDAGSMTKASSVQQNDKMLMARRHKNDIVCI
jgi:hypothetical protein